MNEVIIQNLERKFNTLLNYRKFVNFIVLEVDYIRYICTQEEIWKAIEELAEKDKIDSQLLEYICNTFFFTNDLKEPPFITTKMVKKYKLHKKLSDICTVIDKTDMNKEYKGKKNIEEPFFYPQKAESSIGEDYFFSLQDLHNQIIEQMTAVNNDDIQVSFDSEQSFLIFGNKKVKIQKFSNQYHMLQVIFKDEESKNKDWQFSEIYELNDKAVVHFEWKKLYDVANAIKKNIATETGIKDFFITTTQSIKINRKYLKKP